MARPTPLSDDALRHALAERPGWSRDGDAIVRVYELASFMAVVRLVGAIAERAEAADHHPDLDIRYRRLRVALSTHDAGGLTQLDFDLAREIDELAEGWS